MCRQWLRLQRKAEAFVCGSSHPRQSASLQSLRQRRLRPPIRHANRSKTGMCSEGSEAAPAQAAGCAGIQRGSNKEAAEPTSQASQPCGCDCRTLRSASAEEMLVSQDHPAKAADVLRCAWPDRQDRAKLRCQQSNTKKNQTKTINNELGNDPVKK